VSATIVEGLKKLEIDKHWPPAAAQPWHEVRTDPGGNEVIYFTKKDDHCVFLQDDNLCAIHGRFGAEAKPSFCREFPFHTVEDPTGLVAIVRADCAGFHKTFKDASTIEQGAADAVALPRVIKQRKFEPLAVDVFPGFDVGIDDWLVWEPRLLAVLESSVRSPEGGVAALRDAMNELAERPGGTPNPVRGLMACRAVLQAFRMVMDKVLATDQSAGNPQQVAFAAQMSTWIDTARERAEAGTLAPWSDDAQDYLTVVLRSFIMARQWESGGSVAAGLGRFLFHTTVCRLLAEPAEDGTITAAAWSAVYVKWNRFAVNGTITWTMGKATPAFVDLYRNGV